MLVIKKSTWEIMMIRYDSCNGVKFNFRHYCKIWVTWEAACTKKTWTIKTQRFKELFLRTCKEENSTITTLLWGFLDQAFVHKQNVEISELYSILSLGRSWLDPLDARWFWWEGKKHITGKDQKEGKVDHLITDFKRWWHPICELVLLKV